MIQKEAQNSGKVLDEAILLRTTNQLSMTKVGRAIRRTKQPAMIRTRHLMERVAISTGSRRLKTSLKSHPKRILVITRLVPQGKIMFKLKLANLVKIFLLICKEFKISLALQFLPT